MICYQCKKEVSYKTWGLDGEETCFECDTKDFLWMFWGTLGLIFGIILISHLIFN